MTGDSMQKKLVTCGSLFALIGFLAGQGLPWRIYEYISGGTDRAIDRATKVSQLRNDINDVREDMVQLASDYNDRVVNSKASPSSLFMRILKTRFEYRHNDYMALESSLARIEQRELQTFNLPLEQSSELPIPGTTAAPGRPGLVIDKPTVGPPLLQVGPRGDAILTVAVANGSSYTDDKLMLVTIDDIRIQRGNLVKFRLFPQNGQPVTYGPFRVGSSVPISFAPEADSLVVANVNAGKGLAVLDFHFSIKDVR